MTDLFGNEAPTKEYTGRHQHTILAKRLGPLHYRKAQDRSVRCATCAHHFLRCGHQRIYHKCDLVGCSFSSATDIRAGHVCNAWRKGEEE
jgi:hypothetical protein